MPRWSKRSVLDPQTGQVTSCILVAVTTNTKPVWRTHPLQQIVGPQHITEKLTVFRYFASSRRHHDVTCSVTAAKSRVSTCFFRTNNAGYQESASAFSSSFRNVQKHIRANCWKCESSETQANSYGTVPDKMNHNAAARADEHCQRCETVSEGPTQAWAER